MTEREQRFKEFEAIREENRKVKLAARTKVRSADTVRNKKRPAPRTKAEE